MKKRMLLPINLQYFAEPNEEPTEQNVNEQPEETPEGESPTKKQKVPYDRFKEKIDEVNDLKRQLKEFEEAKQAEETKDLAKPVSNCSPNVWSNSNNCGNKAQLATRTSIY